MHSQPMQGHGSAVVTAEPAAEQSSSLAKREAEPAPGYELLICRLCGRQGAPRPSTRRHTVPCPGCGTNDFQRLVIIALEPSELELLVELVEHVFTLQGDALLEKLYAERRHVPDGTHPS